MDIPWQTRTDRGYKPDLDAWVISRRFPLINNADFRRTEALQKSVFAFQTSCAAADILVICCLMLTHKLHPK